MPGRLSLPSPLHRRIARHASLATLFRQPASPDVGPPASPDVGPRTAPGASRPTGSAGGALPPAAGAQPAPVKAHLLPAESRLPEAYLLAGLPPAAAWAPVPSEPAAPEYPTVTQPKAAGPAAPIQTAPAEGATSRPAPQAPPAFQAQPAAPPQAPPASQVSGPADEDRNWRRLETIFQRHAEKAQMESGGEPAEGAPEPQTDRPEPATPDPGNPAVEPQPRQASQANVTISAAPAPEQPGQAPHRANPHIG